VKVYAEIMAHLGARVERLPGGHVSVSAAGARLRQPPQELAKKLRASYYLLGVMLARFGRAEVGLPGGCDIGLRPIDQHVKGLEALGARVVIEHGVIKAAAESLKAAVIYLDVVSVGATINIMLAATAAEGVTIIENAAKEPHVVDLANFLNAMGGRVVGAGTDVIKVHGGRELRGVEHSIIPDEIEAATYMMAGAGTRGDIIVENVIPKHLDPITAKLREMGAFVEENGDYIRVGARSRLKAANVKTLPYPGFPTDAQQQITPLLSVAEGTSIVTETVFENRFRHVDELKRMGTNIKVEGRTAIIEGVEALSGASVRASDLRAGAAERPQGWGRARHSGPDGAGEDRHPGHRARRQGIRAPRGETQGPGGAGRARLRARPADPSPGARSNRFPGDPPGAPLVITVGWHVRAAAL